MQNLQTQSGSLLMGDDLTIKTNGELNYDKMELSLDELSLGRMEENNSPYPLYEEWLRKNNF